MNVHYKTRQIYSIILISIALLGCRHDKKVDVSDIQVKVKIERFDREFDALRTKPFAQQNAYLKSKYGAFYHDYIKLLLQEPVNTNDTAYFGLIKQIISGKPYHDLEHDVDSVYSNMDRVVAGLTDAFKHIKYYYPNKELPKIYTYTSGFMDQAVISDHYFGIGLDLFLGANSRFYPSLTNMWPRYISRNFNEQNIVPRVVEGMAREDMFLENDSNKTLLSKMIYNGKIMYYMDQILPTVPDSIKIGYTNTQIKWCNQYKSAIWAYFLDENLLYESDFMKIQKFLNPAPFTPGVGEKNDSAPRLAVWTGWQIVKQYMDNNPNVTLQQLMGDNDAQKILNGSKYKP